MNLKGLYVEYESKYPTDKVGFSKFCDSRPKWCIPVTASCMHTVCVCEQHQNDKHITAVIPPYLLDQKPWLLIFSSRSRGRPLFESGYNSRAATILFINTKLSTSSTSICILFCMFQNPQLKQHQNLFSSWW